MFVLTAPTWDEYELLDSGNGKRLERFGKFTISRPDPQVIWKPHLEETSWQKADAAFEKDRWIHKTRIPEKWPLRYKNLTFYAKLSPFKHTGIFPEQISQWDWLTQKLSAANHPTRILNLFGYTGIASLICASQKAEVTHVDASYPTIGWARENQAASGLTDKPVRWILDDAVKFTSREVKRGIHYDGIIMDPPVYGHGPKGEKWDFNKNFPELLDICNKLLTPDPLFILINAYAISASSIMLENVLADITNKLGGTLESGELALKETDTNRLLSTGIFARWSSA